MSGKGDKWRKADFKKYWESDYWTELELRKKEKKEKKD